MAPSLSSRQDRNWAVPQSMESEISQYQQGLIPKRGNCSLFFDNPNEISKVFYATNAIELVNSVIHKSSKNRKVFTSDASATRVLYLAIQEIVQKTRADPRWKATTNPGL